MKNYLFLFSILPVQSFIFQARKTKDLFSGSEILSSLIKFAMNEVNNGEIIFPSKIGKSQPNRFLAKISMSSNSEVKKFGDELESKVRQRFEDKILTGLNSNDILNKLPQNYKDQLNSFLQVYWTAVEINGNDYPQKYLEIEKRLAEIKNYRVFSQLMEKGRKCSVCGERNALIYKAQNKSKWIKQSEHFTYRYFQKDAYELKSNDESSVLLNENEGLCLICAGKRFLPEDISKTYPSTANIAIDDTLNKLTTPNNNALNLLGKFKSLLGKDFDFQLLYVENLTKNYFKKQGLKKHEEKIQQLKNILTELEKYAKNQGLKFTPYYSLVMFDGDSMGQWLSGEFLRNKNDLMEFHRTLSTQLQKYAQSISLSSPKGSIVYAGGDDFLGFFNLNYLFTELDKLYNDFIENVSEQLKTFTDSILTFSAGIVVAHYKMPLQAVLEACKKQEKEAKSPQKNKNGFSLAVLKHSGEINQTTFNWKYNGKSILHTFSDIISLLKTKKISTNFITTFQQEFGDLINQKDPELLNLFEIELSRLIERSINKSYKGKEKKEILDTATEKVLLLLKASNFDYKNFIQSLNTIRFLSTQLNEM